jgi:hypothetical protein
MFKISMSSIAGACAIAMCLLSSGASYAGAVGATGHAFPFTDLACFAFVDGGSVVNNCSTTRSWIVSDNITVAGDHSVLVTGFRPNGGQLVCAACSTTKESGLAQCSAEIPLQIVDRHIQFSLGLLKVPPFGSLFVECRMSRGAHYDSVAF